MQFASHEAPARYLLRNNLGSGHCGAVRIRHCQTKAMLNPAIYGLGKFLLVLVFSPVIFANFFRKARLPPIVKLSLYFYCIYCLGFLHILELRWCLQSNFQSSLQIFEWLQCLERLEWDKTLNTFKRIKLCFKFLRHVWYDFEITSKKFIFVTSNFSWDPLNWSLLFFVFSSYFFIHSLVSVIFLWFTLSDFCDLSYLVVYSHHRESILKRLFRWLEVQLPLIFLRRIVTDCVISLDRLVCALQSHRFYFWLTTGMQADLFMREKRAARQDVRLSRHATNDWQKINFVLRSL